MQEKVAVVGGGLVGCLQALFLANRGYDVTIFERRPDARKVQLEAGRSINLALSTRGITALEKAGITVDLSKIAVPMYGREMHDVHGELSHQPYGNEGECIYSTSRLGLNKLLLDYCDRKSNVKLLFEYRCEGVDLDSYEISFSNLQTDKDEEFRFDRVFGVDGAYSSIRQQFQKSSRFNFSQTYLKHGYKELTIPALRNGEHQINPNALHIWPRGNFMLIALGNIDGTFTSTLFMPFEGEVSFEKLKTKENVLSFFNSNFTDAVALMPNLVSEFSENPTSNLVTVQCSPWNFDDKIMLLGDAAHAIVPFFGQGMNCGFEDCLDFDTMLGEAGSMNNMFKRFSEKRTPNTNAISAMAIQNYWEMCDSTADPMFLLRKKIEKKIANKHPDKWKPLYSMVTFSNIPYADAEKEGKRLSKIMNQIMLRPDIEVAWDTDEVENQILELLNVYA
jgi:kynurenine 3-monooxygenase